MSASSSPNRGPTIIAVTSWTLALTSVIVAARLFCRTRIVRRVTWDDYFIIVAWCIAFALTFSIGMAAGRGLGRHDKDIPSQDWVTLRNCEYAFSILYNPALMATKTSVLIFYLRLSKNTQRVMRIASWAVLTIVNLAGVVLTFINLFQCRPVAAAYDTVTEPAYCIPLLTQFLCSAPVNVLTDLAILALPLPVLTSMRLPRRQKIILIFTFALGIFVTVVDVVRIYYLEQAITMTSTEIESEKGPIIGHSPEFAWNASLSFMWSSLEVNVGIVCACIPTLKPLIRRILPAMLVDPNGTRAYEKGSSTDGNVSSNNARPPTAGIFADGNITPPAPTHFGGRQESQVSSIDFMTTPDIGFNTHSPDPLNRSPTILTSATGTFSMTENSVYFGFVNMRRPKSMIRTSVRDSFKYCTIVIILFLLWGFSYGLLNQLNNAVSTVSGMSTAETIGLSSMYFGGGYLLGPLLVGEWILRHDEHTRSGKKTNGPDHIGGYRATFIVGLCFYGVGTIMFWPSAVLASFAGFMVCNFVVGFGLSIIETGANPFIVFCGPMDYAEMRLCLAQGIQAVATVLSGLLAERVFFTKLETNTSTITNPGSLLDVQWTYLAITLLCAALALFFYYMPLPEVTDTEMETSTRYLPVDPKKRSFGGLQLRTWTLALAVLAQWATVAGQESMSIFFQKIITPKLVVHTANGQSIESLLSPIGLTLSIPDYLLISHTSFALSRFLAAYLAFLSPTHPKVPQPRTILGITTGLSILSGIAVVTLRPENPNLVVIPVVLFYFFEGPLWPLIFALGLRGQGQRTKRAAAYITMGASGPAFWPFVIYAAIQQGGSVQTAFAVVPALFVLSGFFPFFLDMKKDARALVDTRFGAENQSRIQDRANRDMDLDTILEARRRASIAGLAADDEKAGFFKRLSIALSKGSSALPGRKESDPPTSEHREASSGSPG
ncbi:MFS general substrate transporter [Annulohypoxylon maeteangense]|uniref:MFS general substrate transporter n=1 Tax=Annulohypoxylon maeteangense TaxID=1927788 RepID=UPI00200818DF|nr:MFS general substrate transporter [Annulohypoxylon maeteangense]KAI0885714.1 MFS general substrate transporter [Annulohypoxylon maeteangense]